MCVHVCMMYLCMLCIFKGWSSQSCFYDCGVAQRNLIYAVHGILTVRHISLPHCSFFAAITNCFLSLVTFFFFFCLGYDKILSFFIIIILFFNFTILYWFCHISTWIHNRYTRVPHPEPPFPVSSNVGRILGDPFRIFFFFSCTAQIRMESSFLSLIISLINVTSSQPWGLMRKKCYPTSSPSIFWDFLGSPVFMTLYF